MKKLQVLGPGCPKCEKLAARTAEAVERRGVEASVEKVTDIMQITSFGVMMTPALVLDGEVKAKGKLLGVDEIAALLHGEGS